MEIPKLVDPKILILTVPHGASHQRASSALRSALLEIKPGATVEVVNALEHCTRWFRAYYNSYEIPLKYWPAFWGWIESLQDRQGSTSPEWLNRRGAAPLAHFLEVSAPDIVVATEVGMCELAAMIKRENKATYSLVGLELMDFHPAWAQPEVDLFLATHQDLAAELIAAGAPGGKVVTCGQPIDPVFAAPPAGDAARKQLGLDLDVPMLLVLFGGAGLSNPRQILNALGKITLPFQAVFITGRNRRLEREIRKRARHLPHCCVLGWVNNMQDWMAAADLLVSKPGGSTLMEAAACGLPMLAFDPHPGNEVRTCGWIEKWGVGHWVKKAEDLAPAIERLLGNRAELGELRQRASTLARPRAALDAAKAVLLLRGLYGPASTRSG